MERLVRVTATAMATVMATVIVAATQHQQMLQAAIEWRGGLTVEQGAMITMTESTNVPFGRR